MRHSEKTHPTSHKEDRKIQIMVCLPRSTPLFKIFFYNVNVFMVTVPTFVRKVHHEGTKKCEINAKGREGKENYKKKAKVMI